MEVYAEPSPSVNNTSSLSRGLDWERHSELHVCQVPSTLPRDADAGRGDYEVPLSVAAGRKGFVGWITSAVRKQIFGSHLTESGGFSPIGSPRSRASSSSGTHASDRRGLVGIIAPSSVRVDRPVDAQAKSTNGGPSPVYIGSFRNAKGVDMPATIQLAGMEVFGLREDDLAREAARLQRLRHPNVLRFYGIVISPPGPMKLVMENCRHGNLRDELRNGGICVPLDRLLNWSRQLAAGMAHLEHHGIVHGDLRAQNIHMVSIDRCKIANFGMCRTAINYSSKSSKISFAWASPEAIKMQLVTHQSDVWSFGVTLWEIFSHGTTPWKGLNGLEVLNQIDLPLKIRLPRPKHCPTLVYSLVSLCWKPATSDRPTFKALESLWKESHPHRARVIADYDSRSTSELTLTEGDLITLIHRISSEYWYGQNQHGHYGEFPCNHVEQVFLDEWSGASQKPAAVRDVDWKPYEDRAARSSSSSDIANMEDISEPFEFNRHISVPSGTCPKEAQRLLEKEFGMSSVRFSTVGCAEYDLATPHSTKAKPSGGGSKAELSEYEVIQRIMGVDTTAAQRRERAQTHTGRGLRRCPSEPALMPASMLDNEYMSMGKATPSPGFPPSRPTPPRATAGAAVPAGNKPEDEYMYMRSGVNRLSQSVTATSVATATMKKKMPKVRKIQKSGQTSSPPKLPPTSKSSSPAHMRPRASTLNPTSSRGVTKHDRPAANHPGAMTIRQPAVLPKPKVTTPLSGGSSSAPLQRDKTPVNAASLSVQSRIEKLRDRCNSDKPQLHAVNKRQLGGTLTANRRSCSVENMLAPSPVKQGCVKAAIKSLGASDQSLPGKRRVRKTHSRSRSVSGSNGSLPSLAPPSTVGGVLGRRSPRLAEPVSPTSSGYESCGD
eukprot:scpid30696/ scgid2874/ Activated CDC42 kinase 1; Tyrosine kinase non-receptor protein 2